VTKKYLGAAFMAVFVGVSTFASGQDHPVLDAKGIQPHRDYFSQLPVESIDTLSGGVTLTFTDLVVPGNAGHELRFQRSWNSKNDSWNFGIAGVPLIVGDPGTPPVGADIGDDLFFWTPTFQTSDGARRRSTWLESPSTASVADIERTMRWVSTSEFWKYDKVTHTLYLPDGTIAHYDGAYRLVDFNDVFGNAVTLSWQSDRIVITQWLSSEREIVVHNPDPTTLMPSALEFAGRQWLYQFNGGVFTTTSPEGLAWRFSGDFGRQIGVSITGGVATRLRVVLSPAGTVTTAFPF
jgi:hypothetical protein